MIPDIPNLSNPVMPDAFCIPYRQEKAPLVDYARGGVALLDASKGLNVKNWTCEANQDGVFISAPGVPLFKAETLPGEITWISLAFDHNMHYNLAYVLAGMGAFWYWYDAMQQRYVTDSLGSISTPVARMDDVRKYANMYNDIVLSYIRGSALCCRVQRDRYRIEYQLATNAGTTIRQCGMQENNRFAWVCV